MEEHAKYVHTPEIRIYVPFIRRLHSEPSRIPDMSGNEPAPPPTPCAPLQSPPCQEPTTVLLTSPPPDLMGLVLLLLWVLFLRVSVDLGDGAERQPDLRALQIDLFVPCVPSGSSWGRRTLLHVAGLHLFLQLEGFLRTTLPPSVHLFTGDGHLGCFCSGPTAHTTLAFLPDAHV